MKETDTAERVSNLLVEHLGVAPDQVVPEALLVPASDIVGRVKRDGPANLGCDSLDVVEVVMATEETFRIEITDDEAEPLQKGTVRDLIELVDRKRAA